MEVKHLNIDYKAVGRRIKDLRGEESQADFGRRYDKSYTDIGRIERGDVKPTPDLLFNICTDYNKTIEELLTGEGTLTTDVKCVTIDKKIVGTRFKAIRKAQKLTQQSFATALHISSGFVSEIEQGNKMPGSEVLFSLKRVFGINIDELLTGVGYKNDDFVFIPQVSGEISAGGGLIADNTVEMRIAFRKEWIERRGDPRDMSLIRVRGDSMEPTLQSGDLVLIDHGRNLIDPQGGIYAIAMDDTLMFKRLQVIYPQKTLKIISDNSRYEPLEAITEQVRVTGKVIWFGRELEG